MDYHFKVVYRHQGVTKERYYISTKEITSEFNVNRDLVKNIYMKIPKTVHPTIISIERLPVPLRKDAKIVIAFD